MENTYLIYAHINKVNGKIYVGQTKLSVTERWGLNGQRYKRCSKIENAINKYGWDNFEHIVVMENLSKEMADIIEQQLILKYDTIKNGYNLTSGGSKEFNRSKESLKKYREAKLGNKNPFYGKKHPKELKEKIRESSIGKHSKRVINLNTKIIYNSLQDASTDTGEPIPTISTHCMNNTKIINIRWMLYEKYLETSNEELFELMYKKNNRSKSVINLDTYIIYESATKAEIETSINSTLICRHCKNIVKNPRWMYHNDYLNMAS